MATGFKFFTADELLTALGGVSPRRLCLKPAPGTATEADVVRMLERENRLFELVEGCLVEKVMGAKESFVAGQLIALFQRYFDDFVDLGMVLGADGAVRLMPGLVRIPDVSFTSWDRLPGRAVPTESVPDLAPELAVEVLSPGNTVEEMERKLKEYFLAGVKVVWLIDPDQRTVRIFGHGEMTPLVRSETDTLDCEELLPGFRVPVARLFARLPGVVGPVAPPVPPKKTPAKKRK
jgi:Uma2 family endonuclease